MFERIYHVIFFSSSFYRENDEKNSYTMGIFLGGVNEALFAIWPISSHAGVQIGREMVRLITLIGLNKFLINITSPTSLEKFSRTAFR